MKFWRRIFESSCELESWALESVSDFKSFRKLSQAWSSRYPETFWEMNLKIHFPPISKLNLTIPLEKAIFFFIFYQFFNLPLSFYIQPLCVSICLTFSLKNECTIYKDGIFLVFLGIVEGKSDFQDNWWVTKLFYTFFPFSWWKFIELFFFLI